MGGLVGRHHEVLLSVLMVVENVATYRPLSPVEAMKNLFEKYGEVLECQIIQDPVTKRSRLVIARAVQTASRAHCTRAHACAQI